MAKYDINNWKPIHAYVLLPNGGGCGVMAYIGKDVPERLTTLGFLKKWQRSVSRDKKRRKALHITKTRQKCPICAGTIYKATDIKGFIFKWCGRFPTCEYQAITKRRITPNNYQSFICGKCGSPLKMSKDISTNKTMYVCSDYPRCSYIYKNTNKTHSIMVKYKKG